jgi:hypothetical protein
VPLSVRPAISLRRVGSAPPAVVGVHAGGYDGGLVHTGRGVLGEPVADGGLVATVGSLLSDRYP